MFERAFTLPDADLGKSNRNPILQAPFDIIMKTMKNWCEKFQEEGDIKGLVIFGYSLDDHLKFLKYSEDILKNYLYNKTFVDFQETVTVYNPQKRIIFVIRRTREIEDLEHEMKSSIDDILKFVFLYHDILKNSGIKLINLLANRHIHYGAPPILEKKNVVTLFLHREEDSCTQLEFIDEALKPVLLSLFLVILSGTRSCNAYSFCP